MKITHSEIRAYKSCRRMWHLSYRRLLKAKNTDMKLILGRAVHEWLAHYLLTKDDNCDTFLKAFWAEAKGREDSDTYWHESLGLEMIKGYVDWHDENNPYWLEQAEVQFEVPIPQSNSTFCGKIDGLYRTEAGLWLAEHKTAATFPSPESLKNDHQVTAYCWAIEQTYGEPVVGVMYDVLRKVFPSGRVKAPRYGYYPLSRTQDQLRAFQSDLVAVALEMETEPAIYRNPTKDCSWMCPFQSICTDEADLTPFCKKSGAHEELEEAAE